MRAMIRIIEATKDESYLERLLARNQFENEEVNQTVSCILKNVKDKGDEALFDYTEKFDGAKLTELEVTAEEIAGAYREIEPELLAALEAAKENIARFHRAQLREPYILENADGSYVGQLVKPIAKVGVYVPGGTAAYSSTVLMNVVPAKIAGVKEIIMVTPPAKDGSIKAAILVAAKLAGVDRIFKLGGAQAIAALTYGSESVPRVDKIVGPGNIYVAMAKKQVSGYVGIDMIAGPSEILIIADETANPRYVAADLISQAEHDVLAAAILITTSSDLASAVKEELKQQTALLERVDFIAQSLADYGQIIITDTLDSAVAIANQIAPEHLEIMTVDPLELSKSIDNAGAIFLGEYTPEPVGDYYAGPNHTLPTSSTARFSSPLSVDDFIKKSSLIYYNKTALATAKEAIIRIATDEGLTGHANSVRIRFEEED